MVIEFLFVFSLLTGIGNSFPQSEDVPQTLMFNGIGESARYYTDYLPSLNPLSWFRERENFEKVAKTREELLFDVIECLLNTEDRDECKKKLNIADTLFKKKIPNDTPDAQPISTENSTKPIETTTVTTEKPESQTENNS